MSPGARKAARDAGVGWVNSSGAADIYIRDPLIVIDTKGSPPVPLDTRVGWRPARLGCGEALLAGDVEPDRAWVVKATGISTGSVATALKFLEHDGHLASNAARGPGAARRIVDRDELLNAYAAAAERLRSPISIHVGVLWRDPIVGTIELGRTWRKHNIDWAATSALSASKLRRGADHNRPNGDLRARTNAQRSSPSRNSRWPRGDRRRPPLAPSVPYLCGRHIVQARPERFSVDSVAPRLRRPPHDRRAGGEDVADIYASRWIDMNDEDSARSAAARAAAELALVRVVHHYGGRLARGDVALEAIDAGLPRPMTCSKVFH